MFRCRLVMFGMAAAWAVGLMSGCGYECCSHPWFSGWFDRLSLRPVYYEPVVCCEPCPPCCSPCCPGSGVVANAPVLAGPNGAAGGSVLAGPNGTMSPPLAQPPAVPAQQQFAKPAPYVPNNGR